jgi:hypothetical protein
MTPHFNFKIEYKLSSRDILISSPPKYSNKDPTQATLSMFIVELCQLLTVATNSLRAPTLRSISNFQVGNGVPSSVQTPK